MAAATGSGSDVQMGDVSGSLAKQSKRVSIAKTEEGDSCDASCEDLADPCSDTSDLEEEEADEWEVFLEREVGQNRRVKVTRSPDGSERSFAISLSGFGDNEVIMHWGVGIRRKREWATPPGDAVDTSPKATQVGGAMQTVFISKGRGEGAKRVRIEINSEELKSFLFVICQKPNCWIKDGRDNFMLDLMRLGAGQSHFEEAIRLATEDLPEAKVKRSNAREEEVEVAMLAKSSPEACNVQLLVNSPSEQLALHYSTAKQDRKWIHPQQIMLQPTGLPSISEAKLEISGEEAEDYFMFVLNDKETGKWLKDPHGKDFEIQLQKDPAWEDMKVQRVERIKEEATRAERCREEFVAGKAGRRKQAGIRFVEGTLKHDMGELDVAISAAPDGSAVLATIQVWVEPRLGKCLLHWGVHSEPRSTAWELPSDELRPSGSEPFDARACRTPLEVDAGDAQVQSLSLSFPATTTEDGFKPEVLGMSFVLYSPSTGEWLPGADGRDCHAKFTQLRKALGGGSAWDGVTEQILEAECEWQHMSLMHRYNLCNKIVAAWEKSSGSDAADVAQNGEDFWSWIYVWQRFSCIRVLDWERSWCTQPRQLAGSISALAHTLTVAWKAHPICRTWVRWTLATMGRGGGAGQAIRDEILHIMHRRGISERAGHFYEQWHQKLHNNTTPDDIGICRALLAFLRSGGNMGSYWHVLGEHGITRERLASFSRPITTEPYLHGDVGAMIWDFEGYLRTLQSVHDALDLQTALDHSRWCLPGDVQGKLQGICHTGPPNGCNDAAHHKFMRISEVRRALLWIVTRPETTPEVIKELLVLDFSLETQQNVLIQGASTEARLGPLCDQLGELLESLRSHMPEEVELNSIVADWQALAGRSMREGVEGALLLKAMVDRLIRAIGVSVDKFQNFLGPKSALIGKQVGAAQNVLDIFVDEVLRGSAFFSVSLVLQRLDPLLRGMAQLPPWQLVAPVSKPVQGRLESMDRMTEIQHKVFKTPTVLLCGSVNGEEEVPMGVVAVIVRNAQDAPDILSHCAVRARNAGVLVATCFDPMISAKLADDFEDSWVEVICCKDGTISVQPALQRLPSGTSCASPSALSEADMKMSHDPMYQCAPAKMNLHNDLGCSWCVAPNEMNNRNVGSKSLNLALLRPKLPEDVLTPQAVALPYGCMQKALGAHPNSSAARPQLEAALARLKPDTDNEEAMQVFTEVQKIVQEMDVPEDLIAALEATMQSSGQERLRELFERSHACDAIRGVWASLFALRPWVSLAKAGRSFHDLNMAVLVQELVAVKYAFVLHTVNPFGSSDDAREELYGELVAGRGETLVGNYPGRALSFVVRRGGEARLLALPSKSCFLQIQEGLIFRSDSNGEDLKDFAGAGLFESVCAQADKVLPLHLHQMQVVVDRDYRQGLLKRIAEMGWAVERAFGGAPQDIEGCIDSDDRVFIVQSRPQV